MSNKEKSEATLTRDMEENVEVQLAPIKGKDFRGSLPKEYFIKKPWVFLSKFFFALLLIISGSCSINYALEQPVGTLSIAAGLGGVLLCGLIYPHLIELQHECLHFHAFKSTQLNRLFGVSAGLFMFSSHSHYRYEHLRHHAYLGTARNIEHFHYRFDSLNSFKGFLIAFFDLSRYTRIFNIVVSTIMDRPINGISNKKIEMDIKKEYLLYIAIFTTSVVATFYFDTWIFALAWWLPVIFISEGAHFMIEIPEHYGLNTQTVPNLLENTRTIQTNFIVAWYVNGNHTHTAHHFHQGVPMCNVKKLHHLIRSELKIIETSYFAFYRNIISGRVHHLINNTYMSKSGY